MSSILTLDSQTTPGPGLTHQRRIIIDEIIYGDHNFYFVTGGAGTGKTTFIKKLARHPNVNVLIAALTGVAAIMVGATTINRLFMFDNGLQLDTASLNNADKLANVLRGCDVLVLDEVSMVRADILDAIDMRFRKAMDTNLPFGGKKVVFVGDLYQLPPILTKEEKKVYSKFYSSGYFFAAKCLQHVDMQVIHLETVHRQNHPEFIRLLEAVRKGTSEKQVIECLNRKVQPNNDSLVLTPYKRKAVEYNQVGLDLIESREFRFIAKIHGDFVESDFPTERNLVLKEGCKVMLLKNNPVDGYHNGSIGHVTKLTKDSILVLLDTGKEVALEPVTWEKFSYEYNRYNNSVEKAVSGSFIQYPVKLAYALTIHKSQGLTLDKVHLDTGGRIFEHGQLYVALSRLRSPDGLSLEVPLRTSDIFQNSEINKYYNAILCA